MRAIALWPLAFLGYVNERGFPLNNLIAAGSILSVISVVPVFFFVQRRYTQNFSAAGIK
ncbi:hypothetical protein SPF06_10975 [Sinomonas sp. JGH33]|uniref:ABC transmembrane type-1 domain-containing protein n=1 Tax=Sinomonas terricola TaxID=3110330 RepID=A0ABU5T6H8_9MICC|nr:hypothetical protein [Sinomonas sp. JGH33]MEA5455245.1 hypothetical protein [Sinomonas sp. JGH33]